MLTKFIFPVVVAVAAASEFPSLTFTFDGSGGLSYSTTGDFFTNTTNPQDPITVYRTPSPTPPTPAPPTPKPTLASSDIPGFLLGIMIVPFSLLLLLLLKRLTAGSSA